MKKWYVQHDILFFERAVDTTDYQAIMMQAALVTSELPLRRNCIHVGTDQPGLKLYVICQFLSHCLDVHAVLRSMRSLCGQNLS